MKRLALIATLCLASTAALAAAPAPAPAPTAAAPAAPPKPTVESLQRQVDDLTGQVRVLALKAQQYQSDWVKDHDALMGYQALQVMKAQDDQTKAVAAIPPHMGAGGVATPAPAPRPVP